MSFGRKEGVVDKSDTFLHVDRMCVGCLQDFHRKGTLLGFKMGKSQGSQAFIGDLMSCGDLESVLVPFGCVLEESTVNRSC